ncbi:hypothetical protein EP30_07820 [Bifidobacterium sp. UTCIF-39]|uniref:Hsp70 family protein n=1 Tax=Bifidobacterium sp. UTCIF-39 TaxID=1465359 RepID=UPI0011288BE5|nr:Hsp70 family protein [Bifidobacterium sp. UTCIF-39]TPF96427.1 hypothetical protein EP30_07820 [Bifidobacterium sp. UTCIF-39]
MKIGIDFGTSFSEAAAVDEELGTGTTVFKRQNDYAVPSVFYYGRERGVLTGKEAEKRAYGKESEQVVRAIKLQLLDEQGGIAARMIDGRQFSSVQITAAILKEVAKLAISVGAQNGFDDRIEGVVLSVPAKFTDMEKEIIRQAARLPLEEGGPGLNVIGLIKEPVAAALDHFRQSLNDDTRVLVYDLGGGTCDVAMVAADGSKDTRFDVLASEMERCGGLDWDNRLERYLIKECEREYGPLELSPMDRNRIRNAAEQVKWELSDKDTATSVLCLSNGETYEIDVTRAKFEGITRDLLERTMAKVDEVIAKVDGGQVQRIVCVGGSSNMPQVKEAMQRRFPNLPVIVEHPEYAVVSGAAYYAQHCNPNARDNSFLRDRAPLSYGVRAHEHMGSDRWIISNQIRKGMVLPATGVDTYVTHADGTKMRILVFETDEDAETSEVYNSLSDKAILEVKFDFGVKMPRGTRVNVTMTLNTDGLLELEARDEHGHVTQGKTRISGDGFEFQV